MFKERYKEYNHQIQPKLEKTNELLYLAHNEATQTSKGKHNLYRWVAIATTILCISGPTVYATNLLTKQIFTTQFANQEDLLATATQEKSETLYQSTKTFDESTTDLGATPWIERCLSEDSIVEKGTSDTLWTRRIRGTDEETGIINIIYDYPKLSDAFKDYHLNFSLDYLEENYPILDGEYGGIVHFNPNDESTPILLSLFSGFKNEDGKSISIQYYMDVNTSNENEYFVESDYDSTTYYTTADGVKVLLQEATGSKSGHRTYAKVFAEHTRLNVTTYGDFSKEEIYKILDSINISKGMNLDTTN